MSLAHELRVLELPSQVELLDRLQLLTRFNSSLVNVRGVPGAGKTWLAQRFLEAWATDKNQALVLCRPNQTDAHQRTLVLSQLVTDAMFNQDDTIVDSFRYLMGDEPCDVLIAVDDAHLLSEAILTELWMLVAEAAQRPKWMVNIVLFSDGDALEHILTRISYGQENKPIDLEIEPLSRNEAEEFAEQLVVKFAPSVDAMQKIRKQATKCPPLPGALMDLGIKKVERRIIIRSVIESPARIAGVALVILLLTAAGYWWLYSQPAPEPLALASDNGEMVDNGMDSIQPDLAPSSAQDNIANTDDGVEDDSLALPPAVIADTTSVGGGNDDGKRVVVPSDVVDALLEERTPPQTVQVIDDAVTDAKQEVQETVGDTAEPPQAVINDIQIFVEPAPQQEPQPEEVPVVVEAVADTQPAAPEPPSQLTFNHQELNALAPTDYTLQLAALNSEAEVVDFIQTHQLSEGVRIYRAERWFIVTYRNYPTIQQARDAVSELPQSLQSVGAWAKSLSQVQREIVIDN